MSLGRLVYYSAVLAGWAAFLAWAATEFTVFGRLPEGILAVALAGAVGAAIGCAVNVAAGLGQGDATAVRGRALFGLAGGAIGGAVGGAVGNFAFQLGLSRAIGWMLMGIGIGVIDGLQERSASKLRNGLIGGAIGGLIGGLVFDPLVAIVGSATGMSSRATALVVLGLAVGACIGLAQVVLKEAWLTVVDGYRPGRQLILSRPVTTLGRAEYLPLAFIGPMNAGVGPEQVRISRQVDGGFMLEDHGGGAPVAINRMSITGAARLADGDVIKLGPNLIRFNERRVRSAGELSVDQGSTGNQTQRGPSVPLPPPRPVPPPPRGTVAQHSAGGTGPRLPDPPMKPAVSPPRPPVGGTSSRPPGSPPPPPPPPPPPKR